MTLDTSRLETEIEKARNSLKTDRLDMSFGEIISMYERNEIIINPEFQRLFRWSDYQKSRFLESVLLGIPIPPIFVAEDKNGRWELVDGLQRLSTILSFFSILKTMPEKNNWVLEEGELVNSLEGFSCANLPLKFQLNIKRSTCRVEIIRWDSEYDMRFELFNRLNTGGSPLTNQEIRNCIYRGISSNFNNFIKELAAMTDFQQLILPTKQQISELYLEELVLRFMSLYRNIRNVNSSIAQHMTYFMKSAVESHSFDYESYRNIFTKVIKKLKPLGKRIFRSQNGDFATALYDTIMIGIAENYHLYENIDLQLIKRKIYGELMKDEVLIKFSRKGGNNMVKRVQNRIREANRIFGKI
jgi:hypothetical protein